MNLIQNSEKWKSGEIPAIVPLDIKPDISQLIAFGNCFGMNLYRWLIHHKLIQDQYNKEMFYNPFSIMFEFKRVFNPFNWENYIIKEHDAIGDRYLYRDPWRTWCAFSSIDELVDFNTKYDTVVLQKYKSASVVFITYDLSEVWCSADDSEIVFNNLPFNILYNFEVGSFKNRFATGLEVHNAINTTVAIIRSFIGESVPIVFTLSPVPLKYTFSSLPVSIANNLSKATLLTSIHEICAQSANTYYFPSFELIQSLSESQFDIWQIDRRHVTAASVSNIGERFLRYLNHEAGGANSDPFWVPLVNEDGRIIGKLFDNEIFKGS